MASLPEPSREGHTMHGSRLVPSHSSRETLVGQLVLCQLCIRFYHVASRRTGPEWQQSLELLVWPPSPSSLSQLYRMVAGLVVVLHLYFLVQWHPVTSWRLCLERRFCTERVMVGGTEANHVQRCPSGWVLRMAGPTPHMRRTIGNRLAWQTKMENGFGMLRVVEFASVIWPLFWSIQSTLLKAGEIAMVKIVMAC